MTAELSVPKKIGLKVLQTLLEFGADVNAKDEDGRQPILWAASAGSVEAVLALARYFVIVNFVIIIIFV